MGPKGYDQIRSALDEIGLKPTIFSGNNYGAFISPKVEKPEEAVQFFTVGLRSEEGQTIAGILNALHDYVVLDPAELEDDATPDEKREPLLHPVHISDREITFQDLNYPDSE